MTTYLGELQSRTTQNMDQVKEHVSLAHDTAAERLVSFSALLSKQAKTLREQLGTQAEGLKGQLETTATDLRSTLEGKMYSMECLWKREGKQIIVVCSRAFNPDRKAHV